MTSKIIKDAVGKATSEELAEFVDMSPQEMEAAVKAAAEKGVKKVVEDIAKEDSDPDPLFWLKKINKFLEGVPDGITEYFDNLSELGEELVQAEVDAICERASWRINLAVERVRQKVIRTLRKQCKSYDSIIKPMKKFMEALKNPLATIEAVATLIKEIIKKYCGPYYELIKFMVQLVVEVSKLAENLQKIMKVLPPSPPSPNINYDKFALNIGTITMDMLTADDAENLPNPDEVFPEPENKAFSKETFKKAYEKNLERHKEDKFKYFPDTHRGTKTSYSPETSGGTEIA